MTPAKSIWILIESHKDPIWILYGSYMDPTWNLYGSYIDPILDPFCILDGSSEKDQWVDSDLLRGGGSYSEEKNSGKPLEDFVFLQWGV